MNHENPGDGVRCDQCNRTPREAGHPEWCADRLMRNRHKRLCRSCFTRTVDLELAEVARNTPVTCIAPGSPYADGSRRASRRKRWTDPAA